MSKKIIRNPQALIGLLLIAIVLIAALFAPILAPNNPEFVDLNKKYLSAGGEYPLGTDQLGRCVFSRLLYGARYSLAISLPTLCVLALVGLVLGTFSACGGARVDRVMTVICDTFMSFPALVIAVAVIGVLGNGLLNIAIAVIISMWAWFTRTVRSYAVVEMGKDYILATRISGCGKRKLIFSHLIPNIIPQVFVYLSTGIASSIMMVSSFAFLGLGLPTGVAEWGAMLNDARANLYSHPKLLIYPGLCILVTAAGFNMFGEALRDVLLPEEEIL